MLLSHNLLEEMSMRQFYPLYQQQLDPASLDTIDHLDEKKVEQIKGQSNRGNNSQC